MANSWHRRRSVGELAVVSVVGAAAAADNLQYDTAAECHHYRITAIVGPRSRLAATFDAGAVASRSAPLERLFQGRQFAPPIYIHCCHTSFLLCCYFIYQFPQRTQVVEADILKVLATDSKAPAF